MRATVRNRYECYDLHVQRSSDEAAKVWTLMVTYLYATSGSKFWCCLYIADHFRIKCKTLSNKQPLSFGIRIPILKQVWNNGLWNGDLESQQHNALGRIKSPRRFTTSILNQIARSVDCKRPTTTILNQNAKIGEHDNDQEPMLNQK